MFLERGEQKDAPKKSSAPLVADVRAGLLGKLSCITKSSHTIVPGSGMNDSAEDRGTVHVPRTRGTEGCAEEVIGAPNRRCESRAAGKLSGRVIGDPERYLRHGLHVLIKGEQIGRDVFSGIDMDCITAFSAGTNRCK